MNRLAEILLKKSLDDCTVEELQQIVQKYPYFNAGHLLAVQKLQVEQSNHFEKTFQKASLYFHPLYIDQVISGNGNAEIIPTANKTPEDSVGSIEESSGLTNTEPDPLIQEQSNQITEQLTETANNEEASIINETKLEEQLELIGEQDSELKHVESSHNDELLVQNENPQTSKIEAVIQQPVSSPKGLLRSNQNPVRKDSFGATSIQSERTPSEQPVTSTDQLTFEPYHTVDYFASQGIKVKLDDNPTDKFSKQLKSFTEWLKTLKKLPEAAPASSPVNISTEQKVDQLAETSLTDSTVITEAMAEVWVKQGNHQKAIDIYNKLSLLEPSKSTYFASLIEDLKKANL